MQTHLVSISKVKPNKDNPRIIKDYKFKKLVQSIKDFPQMLELRPIVVNEDNIVLGGNMRLKACQEAGLKEVHIIQAKDLTEEQQREFIIKDNVGFGEWDWDILANEWDSNALEEWGMDLPKFPEENLPKDLSDEIDSSYRLEIEFENEEEQEKLYNQLIEKGYICRLLTL
jgi:ParB-like chromosome segregation protein Spo0J